MNTQEDYQYVSAIDFVDEILSVAEKYGLEKMFEGYLGRFMKDLKNKGLITNENDEEI